MKRILILLSVLVVSLLLYVQLVSAQPVNMQSCTITNPCTPTPAPLPVNLDRDNDGQNDDVDQCPGEAGPSSNGGCPVANDNDGDGILNDVDRCPDESGTAENGGCPADAADADGDGVADAQDQCPAEAGPAANNGCLPVIPDTGDCQIATAGNQVVNVRSEPSTTASIVDTLSPAQIYAVGDKVRDGELEVWYQVAGGWVSETAVRSAGDCSVPYVPYGDVMDFITPIVSWINPIYDVFGSNPSCGSSFSSFTWFNAPCLISTFQDVFLGLVFQVGPFSSSD